MNSVWPNATSNTEKLNYILILYTIRFYNNLQKCVLLFVYFFYYYFYIYFNQLLCVLTSLVYF